MRFALRKLRVFSDYYVGRVTGVAPFDATVISDARTNMLVQQLLHFISPALALTGESACFQSIGTSSHGMLLLTAATGSFSKAWPQLFLTMWSINGLGGVWECRIFC